MPFCPQTTVVLGSIWFNVWPHLKIPNWSALSRLRFLTMLCSCTLFVSLLLSVGPENVLRVSGHLRCFDYFLFIFLFSLAVHPCMSGTSGCTHLCLIVPSGYKCDCPAVIEDAQGCSVSYVPWPPTPSQPPTTTPTTAAPTTPDYCASNPCENGATCETVDGSFSCECEVYFAGTTCSLNYGEFNLYNNYYGALHLSHTIVKLCFYSQF